MSSSTRPMFAPGRVALVTGSTTGLGRQIALQLAAEGVEVVVVGRNAARGAGVVAEIEAAGGKARFAPADLDEPAEIERLAREVGDIDILVNNAGHSVFGPTARISVPDFDGLFASNVRAPFLLVAAFAPAMAARGYGSIVNVASMAGRLGLANGAAYGASKAALVALTQGWTAEFSPRGVRVNAVAPGPIHTREKDRAAFDALGGTTVLKRAAEPYEIADVAVFLASDHASYLTGAVVDADGGRTAT